MKKTALVLLLAAVITSLVGCEREVSDARIASRNLSTAANMFEISRRVIFYNGITGGYMLSIEGRCSIEDQTTQLEVTCKVSEWGYKKHFLGLSDNVTYFVEHLEPTKVSAYHYRVIFKPQTIIPDIDFRGSASEALKAITPDNND